MFLVWPFGEKELEDTELEDAILRSDREGVARTLNRYPAYTDVIQTAFLIAIAIGNKEIVTMLIHKGADVRANTEEALSLAAAYGHVDLVRLFVVEYGCDIHAVEDDPLNMAVLYKHTNVAHLLLIYGANAQANNNAALKRAVDTGNVYLATLLLDYDADIHVDDDRLLLTAVLHNFIAMTELLLTRGSTDHPPPSWQQKKNESLWHAAYEGHLTIMQVLLDHGADVHAENDRALYETARQDEVQAARLLLSYGATDRDGRILRKAIRKGSHGVANLLRFVKQSVLPHSLSILHPSLNRKRE